MAAVLLYVCSTFVVWICCLTAIVDADTLNCPSSCSCLKTHATCSQTGLINVPKDIPPWITHVELRQNGITEIRADDFKGLDNIKFLDISENNIQRIDGAVFKDLKSLRILKLDNNALSEIPLFPEKSGITEISLSSNSIGSISMDALLRMPNLTSLDLSQNKLFSVSNGTFPAGCQLQSLNLNHNNIAVLEKGAFGNLTELVTLRMSKNKLRELPVLGFKELKKLKNLEIMKNELTAIRGRTFEGMEQLQTLKLKRNQISVLDTAAFFNLGFLVNLQMGHNKVTAIRKEWLFGLKSLKTLSLPRNKISVIDPQAWVCKQLEKLDLSNNHLSAIMRDTLSPLKQLRQLVLNNNQISRIDDGAFSELGKLHTLEINNNFMATSMEDVSGVFHSLSRLNRLSLRNNSITSIAVHAFSGLQQLQQLELDDNEITSIQENAFETLRRLQTLSFNSSKLTCDCHLAWLPRWLQSNGFHYAATGACFHPPLLKGLGLFKVDMNEECDEGQYLKPVILVSPQSRVGFKGENLSLVCGAAVTGNSQPIIRWERNNELLPSSWSDVKASRDGDINRYNSTLTLHGLRDSSAGQYQCVVSNAFGHAKSQVAFIKVYVFPAFTEKPVDVTVKAGRKAELKCAATGHPDPTIKWQKDGGGNFPAANDRRMQVLPGDHYFFITNVQAADEGVYTCIAHSEAGTVTSNATLTVLETPGFIEPMQKLKKTRKGDTAVLQCMASGSPQPKLSWLKDEAYLVVTPRHFFTKDNQILVIVDTDWSDAGTYSCRISNPLGTARDRTELKVLTESGEPVEASSSSFSLDDDSTTTGIIIIAVVCCVVGTSLVWVIIIYQTKKQRPEMYSAAPSDETTLPGEVPSSGYMSSDREGSYSQGGPLTLASYHYQDYQMKESGYESSSGQLRVAPSGMYPNSQDEDDPAPTLTAGDRLLRQMAPATSTYSLRYPGSDDADTIDSRHSSSSGHHSGTSGDGQVYTQHGLHVQTGMYDARSHNLHPSQRSLQQVSPGSDCVAADRGPSTGTTGSTMSVSSPERKPLLQTFHPKKHASLSQERFHANTLDGVHRTGGACKWRMLPQRRARSRDAVAVTESGEGERWMRERRRGSRFRNYSDSCDVWSGQYSDDDDCETLYHQRSPCTTCRCGANSRVEEGFDNFSNNFNSCSSKDRQSEKHFPRGNKSCDDNSACSTNCCSNSGGCCSRTNNTNNNSNNSNNCDGNNSTCPPPSSTSPSPFSSFLRSHQPPASLALRHHPYHNHHHQQQQHDVRPGSANSHNNKSASSAKGWGNNNNRGGSSGKSNVSNKKLNNHRKKYPSSGSNINISNSNAEDIYGEGCNYPCCCEVMRDTSYCTTCPLPPNPPPPSTTNAAHNPGVEGGQHEKGCQQQRCHHGNNQGRQSRENRGEPSPQPLQPPSSASRSSQTQDYNHSDHVHKPSLHPHYHHQPAVNRPSALHPPPPPPPYTPPGTPPPYMHRASNRSPHQNAATSPPPTTRGSSLRPSNIIPAAATTTNNNSSNTSGVISQNKSVMSNGYHNHYNGPRTVDL